MKNPSAHWFRSVISLAATSITISLLAPSGFAGDSPSPATETSAAELQQLRMQVAEQGRRIDRLYDALAPQLEELEQRAAAMKKQAEEDAALKLETVCVLKDQGLTTRAQFSPTENSFAVITHKGSVQIFTTAGKNLRELALPEMKVNAIAYAPDGKRLLAGTKDGKVLLWDVIMGESRIVFTNIAGMVGRVAWLANPERGVATGDLMGKTEKAGNQTGIVFRLADGMVLAKFTSSVRGDYQQLAVSPDGRWLGVLEIPGQARAGFLLDAENGRMKAKLFDEEYGSGPLSINIAPDNNTVAIGYAPYHVSLWDGAQQKELRLVKAHSNWVTTLGFSPDSRRLISGGGDNTARIWDVATGEEIGRIRVQPDGCIYVNSVSFSADGKFVLAAAENDTLIIAKAPK
jgi:WD40 repeat protein